MTERLLHQKNHNSTPSRKSLWFSDTGGQLTFFHTYSAANFMGLSNCLKTNIGKIDLIAMFENAFILQYPIMLSTYIVSVQEKSPSEHNCT